VTALRQNVLLLIVVVDNQDTAVEYVEISQEARREKRCGLV